MGYCIQQGQSQFRMAASQLPGAFATMKAMAEATKALRGRFAWVTIDTLLRARTVDEHLAEWGWKPLTDPSGDIIGLALQNEKLGDDKKLFDALAPYVDPGSFIVVHGEEGDTWRWYFDGSRCIEQPAQVGFGQVPGDIVDVEAREVKPMDRALAPPAKRLGYGQG